jgi:hypothetical protein
MKAVRWMGVALVLGSLAVATLGCAKRSSAVRAAALNNRAAADRDEAALAAEKIDYVLTVRTSFGEKDYKVRFDMRTLDQSFGAIKSDGRYFSDGFSMEFPMKWKMLFFKGSDKNIPAVMFVSPRDARADKAQASMTLSPFDVPEGTSAEAFMKGMIALFGDAIRNFRLVETTNLSKNDGERKQRFLCSGNDTDGEPIHLVIYMLEKDKRLMMLNCGATEKMFGEVRAVCEDAGASLRADSPAPQDVNLADLVREANQRMEDLESVLGQAQAETEQQ